MLSYELYDTIEWYFQVSFIAINTISCLFNIYIFIRKSFRSTQIGFYLICLSISDLFTNLSVFKYVNSLYWFNVNTSPFLCRMSRYTVITSAYFSPWISVIIAIDRAISIVSTKAHLKLQQLKIKVTIVGMTCLILCTINIQSIIDGYIFIDQTYVCHAFYTNFYFGTSRIVVDLIFSSTLPFMLMTIANIISTVFLIRSKQRVNMAINREKKFAATIIGLNMSFFIVNTPEIIYALILICKYESMYGYSQIYWQYIHAYDSDSSGLIILLTIFIFKCLYSPLQTVVYLVTNSVYRLECKKSFSKFKLRMRSTGSSSN